jgi:hypothetical protein
VVGAAGALERVRNRQDIGVATTIELTGELAATLAAARGLQQQVEGRCD